MVSERAWNVVDRVFDPCSGQIKVHKIGNCYFSAKHATLRSKRKDWLVFEWSDMSTMGLLYQ